MKQKIVGMLICTLLIATATTTIVSSRSSEPQEIMMPSVVDQQQPNTPELHWLIALPTQNWQQFKNMGKTLEKVELHIGCWFTGSAPITMEIKETLTGTTITQVTYNAVDLPLDMQAWFTFDVPDARLTQNKVYYIILTFDPGSEYAWSGSHNNPYPNGTSSHPDSDWDYAFRTIVDKSTSWETVKTYEPADFAADGGFVCCGALEVNISSDRPKPFVNGTNFVFGKYITIEGDLVCVGVAGWKVANYLGCMEPGGGPFYGKLHINKFWGAVIKLNDYAYILTGLGNQITYTGDEPTP
jgi:hypothetical protein